MAENPIELYKVESIRALEAIAKKDFSLTGHMLMERAGRAAFGVLQEYFGDAERIAVICGTGNNAGDAYILARLAHQHEIEVKIYTVGKSTGQNNVTNAAAKTCRALGIPIKKFTASIDLEVDVIVDGLLGIGLSGPIRGPMAEAITLMNQASAPILSLDVPSGIDADTGAVMGIAINASVTITFLAMKQGLLTAAAREMTGALVFNHLDVPEKLYARVPCDAIRIDEEAIRQVIPDRKRDAHKAQYGHVLAIGGDYGLFGAIRLTAEAALRSGAGLVTVATRPENVSALVTARPELMCHGISNAAELLPLLKYASVIVIGPGLGVSDWGTSLFTIALASGLPMIIDAQALRLLAKSPTKRDNWILTPHPGEATALLDGASVQTDRFDAVARLQARYGGVAVLKGAGTCIKSPEGIVEVCAAGNPGMASPGMGDVLAGVIAGLLAQHFSLNDAARVGVCAHAMAGDWVAKRSGERGLLALDLMPALQRFLNNPADDSDETYLEDEFGVLGNLVASANDEDD